MNVKKSIIKRPSTLVSSTNTSCTNLHKLGYETAENFAKMSMPQNRANEKNKDEKEVLNMISARGNTNAIAENL